MTKNILVVSFDGDKNEVNCYTNCYLDFPNDDKNCMPFVMKLSDAVAL